jgi:NAD(P)-dependent dehydrogenase (short-subunit alcohol dehydrogenase family)
MSAALITGASRGIGRGIALALARAGHDIVVNYASNAAAAAEVVKQAEDHGVRAISAQADISLRQDRQRLVEATFNAFGGLELLVNNAGVAPSDRVDILEATEDSFERMLSINLMGPYFLTQLVANGMLERGVAGQIVTVCSISAYTASTNRGDYCIAKAGLAMMTALYAARLAQNGINVYEIRPGMIDTDMTGPVKAKYDKLIFEEGIMPIRRWGQPDDVGRAVVAIASGLFPYSTGQVIDVDGGFHLRTL